jgi:hypothetical protein
MVASRQQKVLEVESGAFLCRIPFLWMFLVKRLRGGVVEKWIFLAERKKKPLGNHSPVGFCRWY